MRGYNYGSCYAFHPASLAFLGLCALALVCQPADLAAQQKMRTAWRAYPKGGVYSLSFSPDGKRVATVGAERTPLHKGLIEPIGSVRVWDSHTEKCLDRYDLEPATGLRHVAFLPSGDALRVSTFRITITTDGRFRSTWGGDVRHYDLRTGKSKREWTALANERIVALWADMAVAAWGENDTGAGRSGVKLIHLNTGKVTARPIEGPFRLLGLSRDRKLALLDLSGRKVRVVDLATGKAVGEAPLAKADPARCVLTPDNKTLVELVTLEQDPLQTGLIFWDIRTGKKTDTRKRRWNYRQFGDISPDGRYLTLLGVVDFYDLKERRYVPKATVPWGGPNCLSFTPDGQAFAIGTGDGTICIFEMVKE